LDDDEDRQPTKTAVLRKEYRREDQRVNRVSHHHYGDKGQVGDMYGTR